MKIEELRIGNCLPTDRELGGYDYARVVALYGDKVELVSGEGHLRHIEYLPNDSVGITLTVEWLKRLGFNQSDVVVSEYYKGWFSVQCNKGILFRCNDGCIDKKRLLYVHELQNLYYALTGEELVIGDAAEKDLGK